MGGAIMEILEWQFELGEILSFLISFISYINVWDVRLCYSLDYIV
jgi:hypothetical protein